MAKTVHGTGWSSGMFLKDCKESSLIVLLEKAGRRRFKKWDLVWKDNRGNKTQGLLVSISFLRARKDNLIKMGRGCMKEYRLLKWYFYCSTLHHFATFCAKHPSFPYFINISITFLFKYSSNTTYSSLQTSKSHVVDLIDISLINSSFN